MNKTQAILDQLQQRLVQGQYPPGSKFPSEYTLADEFKVSKVTINKIVSLLVEKGYLQRGPRGAGTKVAPGGSSGILAYIAPPTRYNNKILMGILSECVRQNYLLMYENSRTVDLELRVSQMIRQGVGGFLCLDRNNFPIPPQYPMVWLDCGLEPRPEHENCLFINSDDLDGGRKMMTEIFNRNHRDVLVYSSERYTLRQDNQLSPRLQGFLQIMQEWGVSDPERRIFYGARGALEDAILFLDKYLPKFPACTIIAADTDSGAQLLHRASLLLHRKIPGNVALTGFGNITDLPIATVDQQPERQGVIAVRELLQAIKKKRPIRKQSELIPTSLSGLEHIPYQKSMA
ncbi:MAG: substrate-binding domain-containing protein [Lentisphaerae bacterium]|jgi:GntR family transcriptional regulator of arabinose operon|nr:substrate-binding domain-containing protein [Lentisphaerota bacterium]